MNFVDFVKCVDLNNLQNIDCYKFNSQETQMLKNNGYGVLKNGYNSVVSKKGEFSVYKYRCDSDRSVRIDWTSNNSNIPILKRVY